MGLFEGQCRVSVGRWAFIGSVFFAVVLMALVAQVWYALTGKPVRPAGHLFMSINRLQAILKHVLRLRLTTVGSWQLGSWQLAAGCGHDQAWPALRIRLNSQKGGLKFDHFPIGHFGSEKCSWQLRSAAARIRGRNQSARARSPRTRELKKKKVSL